MVNAHANGKTMNDDGDIPVNNTCDSASEDEKDFDSGDNVTLLAAHTLQVAFPRGHSMSSDLDHVTHPFRLVQIWHDDSPGDADSKKHFF